MGQTWGFLPKRQLRVPAWRGGELPLGRAGGPAFPGCCHGGPKVYGTSPAALCLAPPSKRTPPPPLPRSGCPASAPHGCGSPAVCLAEPRPRAVPYGGGLKPGRHSAAWARPSAPSGPPPRPDGAAVADAATTSPARRGPFLRAAWAPFAPSLRTPMPSGKLPGSGWPGPSSTRALAAAPPSKRGWEWEEEGCA